MPYIQPQAKVKINSGVFPDNVGELNYFITKTLLQYTRAHGGDSYKVFNDVIGVLECVKQEMYRRRVSPYEDIKAKENGDIFDTPYTESIQDYDFDGESG